MTRKEHEYIGRLKKRMGILDFRLEDCELLDTSEIKMERNALAWAIDRIEHSFRLINKIQAAIDAPQSEIVNIRGVDAGSRLGRTVKL